MTYCYSFVNTLALLLALTDFITSRIVSVPYSFLQLSISSHIWIVLSLLNSLAFKNLHTRKIKTKKSRLNQRQQMPAYIHTHPSLAIKAGRNVTVQSYGRLAYIKYHTSKQLLLCYVTCSVSTHSSLKVLIYLSRWFGYPQELKQCILFYEPFQQKLN